MNRVYKWYLRMHNSNYAFIRRFIEVMLHYCPKKFSQT